MGLNAFGWNPIQGELWEGVFSNATARIGHCGLRPQPLWCQYNSNIFRLTFLTYIVGVHPNEVQSPCRLSPIRSNPLVAFQQRLISGLAGTVAFRKKCQTAPLGIIDGRFVSHIFYIFTIWINWCKVLRLGPMDTNMRTENHMQQMHVAFMTRHPVCTVAASCTYGPSIGLHLTSPHGPANCTKNMEQMQSQSATHWCML